MWPVAVQALGTMQAFNQRWSTGMREVGKSATWHDTTGTVRRSTADGETRIVKLPRNDVKENLTVCQSRCRTEKSSYPTTHMSFDAAQYSYPTTHLSYDAAQYSYPTTHQSYDAAQYSYPTTHLSHDAAQYSYPTTHLSYDATHTYTEVKKAEASMHTEN